MKTFNVSLGLQLDLPDYNPHNLEDWQRVVSELNYINAQLSTLDLNSSPQLFVNAVDVSDIIEQPINEEE